MKNELTIAMLFVTYGMATAPEAFFLFDLILLSSVTSFLWERPEGFEHTKEGQQWIRPPHQRLSQAPI